MKEKLKEKFKNLKNEEETLRARYNATRGGINVIDEMLESNDFSDEEKKKLKDKKDKAILDRNNLQDNLNFVIGSLSILENLMVEEEKINEDGK